MGGFLTNNVVTVVPSATAGALYSAVTGYERAPFDTELASGAIPQTVAMTTFQVAALAAAAGANTATATSGAATLNTIMGTVTTESLTTAAAAVYTLTLTNSVVTATSNVQAAVYSKSNTTPGVVVQSIVPAAGSVVIKVLNNGTAALNGTLSVVFQVSAD